MPSIYIYSYYNINSITATTNSLQEFHSIQKPIFYLSSLYLIPLTIITLNSITLIPYSLYYLYSTTIHQIPQSLLSLTYLGPPPQKITLFIILLPIHPTHLISRVSPSYLSHHYRLYRIS